MKTKSLTLKQLEEDGWEIDDKDQNAIALKIAQDKYSRNMEAVVKAVAKATELNQKSTQKSMTGIEAVLKAQTSIMQQFVKQANIKPEKAPNSWSFDVQRNKKGFISKIFATPKKEN